MHRKLTRQLIFVAIVMLLLVSSIGQWPFAIRFYYSPLNNWFFALLLLLLPISIISIGRAFDRRALRWLTITTGIVLLIPSLLIGCIEIFIFGGLRVDPYGYELRSSLADGQSNYRVYIDSNGGAFAPPYIELRKEIDTPLGFKLVRSMWTDSRYDDVDLRIVDGSTLEVLTDGEIRAKLRI